MAKQALRLKWEHQWRPGISICVLLWAVTPPAAVRCCMFLCCVVSGDVCPAYFLDNFSYLKLLHIKDTLKDVKRQPVVTMADAAFVMNTFWINVVLSLCGVLVWWHHSSRAQPLGSFTSFLHPDKRFRRPAALQTPQPLTQTSWPPAETDKQTWLWQEQERSGLFRAGGHVGPSYCKFCLLMFALREADGNLFQSVRELKWERWSCCWLQRKSQWVGLVSVLILTSVQNHFKLDQNSWLDLHQERVQSGCAYLSALLPVTQFQIPSWGPALFTRTLFSWWWHLKNEAKRIKTSKQSNCVHKLDMIKNTDLSLWPCETTLFGTLGAFKILHICPYFGVKTVQVDLVSSMTWTIYTEQFPFQWWRNILCFLSYLRFI